MQCMIVCVCLGFFGKFAILDVLTFIFKKNVLSVAQLNILFFFGGGKLVKGLEHYFRPVWLRDQVISAGLGPVFIHDDKKVEHRIKIKRS